MMRKYFCVQIHTERLHDEKTWQEVEGTLRYFAKHNIRATWYSINPTFVGYRVMGFDENKWKERLQIISSFRQDIQQHTHFYKGKEGVPKGEGYDMTREHIEERLQEDKKWLEAQGFEARGFVSGAWKTNDALFAALGSLGYLYDSSTRGRDIETTSGILRIPVSGKVRQLLKGIMTGREKSCVLNTGDKKICTLAFHDYDLESSLFRAALRFILTVFRSRQFQFVVAKKIYEQLS